MNKWIYLVAACFMLFAFIVTVPVTYHSPAGSNLVISIALFAMAGIGFWLFFRSGKRQNQQKQASVNIDGRKLVPIE